ncbi:MAG: ThiF family adenylyltransferase [Firmicutes bacterium]|uniref:ThiF family adenylyltransferase n=1 Tax=Candidatus Onthovivens merdipullorum TaxID=2840889 RepID=A0A9D9DI90_9BACL|nr:ThiF family adenylyltransferase [Candidatus Onthovivens merdipullorum]
MSTIDDRTKLLLSSNFDKLKDFKIAVIGLGGVGSIIPLVLVRSGFLNLIIDDFDTVDITNLNRQLAYDLNDLGKPKSLVIRDKIFNIRKNLNVLTLNEKIDDNFNFDLLNDCDYIIDCIDDIEAKILLIKYAISNNIKIVSSLGMGNRLDSTKVVITKLNKTTSDPLAKKLRYLLKKENIDISKLYVSFSLETPIIKSNIISSMAFVPNASGLAMASFAIMDLLNLKE